MEFDRLSYAVERYFFTRGTGCVLISWRNGRDLDAARVRDDAVTAIQETPHDWEPDGPMLDGLVEGGDPPEVVDTAIAHGDYWTGVLVEVAPDGETDLDRHPYDVDTSTVRLRITECVPGIDTMADGVNVRSGNSAHASSCLEDIAGEFFGLDERPDGTWVL